MQPFQSRALAVLSRASLRSPYSLELPTVRQLHLRPRRRRTGGHTTTRRDLLPLPTGKYALIAKATAGVKSVNDALKIG